jgi:ABC-type transport system involved in multi-copper enzyme maturation permease subunit
MIPTVALPTDDRARYRVTLIRVINSELTKLLSVRSTWILLGAAVALMITLATVGGALYTSLADAGEFTPTRELAIGAPFVIFELVALIVGCLGVVSMAGEHSTGAIQATLIAVPRRLPVLWAKGIALGVVGGPVLLAANVASFLGFQALAGQYGAPLIDPTALRVIVSATAVAMAFGLLGLGIGAALRNPVAAIVVLVGLLHVAPVLLVSLPTSPLDIVIDHLPVAAAKGVITSKPKGAGELARHAVIVAGWVVVGLAGGAAVLNRYDP